jgi:hypothetical protein
LSPLELISFSRYHIVSLATYCVTRIQNPLVDRTFLSSFKLELRVRDDARFND